MFEKEFNCGKTVFVSEHNVGFAGGHPSGVDYYYSDAGGYGCQSEEDVALLYHENFCDCSKSTAQADRLLKEQNIRFLVNDSTLTPGERISVLKREYSLTGNQISKAFKLYGKGA